MRAMTVTGGPVRCLVAITLLCLLAGCVADGDAAAPRPTPPPSVPSVEEREPLGATAGGHWLAPDGDDEGPGTRDAPWGSLTHALAQLEAGDVLHVADGTYRERVLNPPLSPGEPDAPIRVVAAPDADPLLQGLLWLSDADHWSIEGLDVTWDSQHGAADEHMVKFSGGEGWQFLDAEVWGARSFAAILVADAPSDWRLADLCVHDTRPTNDTNQDHLIYVNSGSNAGPGLIERSLLFGAPNGSGVKLGGPSSDSEGTVATHVRDNTIVEAAQPVLIAWTSSGNVIERNLLGDAGDGYGAVRGYRLDGDGNVARDNVGFGAAALLLSDDGHRGVADGGGNQFPVEPNFDRRGSCDGYRPGTGPADERGHLAAP